MTVRSLARSLTAPLALSVIKSLFAQADGDSPEARLEAFIERGRIPWSPGYDLYKRQFITRMLDDSRIVELFRLGQPLPRGYGHGVDERCVEYPWLFSRLSSSLGKLLDAGSVFNHEYILDRPALVGRQLHILTLGPEGRCYWFRGISYLFGDLRDIPIRDNFYDEIACISTLEHVGLDNTNNIRNPAYEEYRPEDFQTAMREMNRVLKPGGSLYLTVPFGAYQNFRVFQQFDAAHLDRAIGVCGPAEIHKRFYRYGADGWQLATEAACVDCRFSDWLARNLSGTSRSESTSAEADLAAAARAVACVQLVKRRP